MRRTKIVCTIGPASESLETLEQLVKEGMNVARLNFSHGTHEEHEARLNKVREASRSVGLPIATLLDTKGPEIRLGMLKESPIELRQGQPFTLTTAELEGDGTKATISYKHLPQDVKPGSTIRINDGLVGLKVVDVVGEEIHCEVVNGGEIGSRKGVNVPGVVVGLPAVTEKDVADIEFAVSHNMDYIAASFVRKASDVLDIRRILERLGSEIQIIAKIESHEGVSNIDEILKVADGIMVARGDLGVEIPTEEVPLVQKMIIEKCNKAGKPVVTATQMLESMVRNPRPTRAEASDVANAIFDGTDAIMLSAETAAGKYPVETVQTMGRIAARAEEAVRYEEILARKAVTHQKTTTDAISHATVTTAQDLGASAIITATKSGYTARMVSKYRPRAPIIAVSPLASVVRKLQLVWGVQSILVAETQGTDEMLDAAVQGAQEAGLIAGGDLVVITAGVPTGVQGTTNLLKVHVVGNVLAKGSGIGTKAVSGPVKIARTAQQAVDKVAKGDILVCEATDRDFIPALEKAGAVITEEGGLTSHGAVVGLSLGIPVIVGVESATSLLQDNQEITVDSVRGLVYSGKARIL